MGSVPCQEHLVSCCLAATAGAATPFVRGESCAVPWLHQSGGRSRAQPYINSVLPSWGQGAGSLSIPPLALVGGRASAECLWANIGHGTGCQQAECHGHCLVTTKTLQSSLFLYLAQISLFESIILSSSGIIISNNNINSNNSSLLQPIPFFSIPVQIEEEESNAPYSCDLAVIYIYPELYTAASQSPLCHHSKQVFSSTVQMRRTGMTGTALGSSGARELNVAPFWSCGKKSTIRFEWSS